jgi:phage terminase large subunit-like protein
MLREMTTEERSRLEDGNWEARRNARFKRRWQRFYQLNVPPELLQPYPCNELDELINYQTDISQYSYSFTEFDHQGNTIVDEPIPLRTLRKVFTTVDPAVTVRQGPVDDQLKLKNSYAVVSVWGVTMENSLLWLNCRKFRKEIPDLVEHIVQANAIWQPQYNKIECNGVGIGVAQYCEAAGVPVVKNYKKTDKLENSLSAQMLMKSGRVWFPINATWLEDIEDDIFSWTGLPTEEDDVIDTLSDASTELAEGVAKEVTGQIFTATRPRAVPTVLPTTSVTQYGFQGQTANLRNLHSRFFQ